MYMWNTSDRKVHLIAQDSFISESMYFSVSKIELYVFC